MARTRSQGRPASPPPSLRAAARPGIPAIPAIPVIPAMPVMPSSTILEDMDRAARSNRPAPGTPLSPLSPYQVNRLMHVQNILNQDGIPADVILRGYGPAPVQTASPREFAVSMSNLRSVMAAQTALDAAGIAADVKLRH